MNTEDIISDIITLEDQIAILYSNLYETELSGDKEGCIYSHYINELKDALKAENKLFSSFDLDCINSFGNYFKKNYQKIQTKFASNPFTVYVLSRIIYTLDYLSIDKFINKKKSDDSDRIDFSETLEKRKMNNIIISEYIDIFLSFLDEFIESCDDVRIKEFITFKKYTDVCRIGNVHGTEDKVVNRYFNTDKSLYLSSFVEASIEGINMNAFLAEKNEKGLLIIERAVNELMVKDNCYIKSYKNNSEEALTIDLMLRLRSAFLLLDEDTFKKQINNINGNLKVKEVLQIAFGEDILGILIKDRERNKRLSLVRRK